MYQWYLGDSSLQTTAILLDSSIDERTHDRFGAAVEQSLTAYGYCSDEAIRRSDEAMLHEDGLIVPVYDLEGEEEEEEEEEGKAFDYSNRAE